MLLFVILRRRLFWPGPGGAEQEPHCGYYSVKLRRRQDCPPRRSINGNRAAAGKLFPPLHTALGSPRKKYCRGSC